MKVLWVILNEDKDAIVESFETSDSDSRPHWDKFINHKAGTVFCRISKYGFRDKPILTWYYNYFFWEDQGRWGYGAPSGVAFSAAMAVPEILKMLELVE